LKKTVCISLLSVALIALTLLPVTVSAGQSGNMKGNTVRSQDRTLQRTQDRQRLRDGSCLNQTTTTSGAVSKKGNAYGPGDGTGPYAPKDGTGYGAPSQR
jgi:hypothetical protein